MPVGYGDGCLAPLLDRISRYDFKLWPSLHNDRLAAFREEINVTVREHGRGAVSSTDSLLPDDLAVRTLVAGCNTSVANRMKMGLDVKQR